MRQLCDLRANGRGDEGMRTMERDVIVDPVTGRFVCTAAQPWVGKALRAQHSRACHPDAVGDGGCANGCCDDWRCPHCDTRWRERCGQ